MESKQGQVQSHEAQNTKEPNEQDEIENLGPRDGQKTRRAGTSRDKSMAQESRCDPQPRRLLSW